MRDIGLCVSNIAITTYWKPINLEITRNVVIIDWNVSLAQYTDH